MKVGPGMMFRLALLLITTVHNIGIVDGSSLSRSASIKGCGDHPNQKDSGNARQNGLLEAWLSSQAYNPTPTSEGQTTTQRPKSFFPSQADPTECQPKQSICQSRYRTYSGFGSSPSSDRRPFRDEYTYGKAAVSSSQSTRAGSGQSSDDPVQGRQVVQGKFLMLRSQHSRGQTQTDAQTQTNSKPVTTSKATIYKPLLAQGVRNPWSQSLDGTSTSSSLSPRSLQTTYKPVQSNYQSSMNDRKPQMVSRPVGRTQGVASGSSLSPRSLQTTYKPVQSNYQSSMSDRKPQVLSRPVGRSPPASSSHSSFSSGRGTLSPRSFHTFYKPPHSAPPIQRWVDPAQNWNLQSPLGSNRQYFGPPQSEWMSRPSVSSIGQNTGGLQQLIDQHSAWKPAGSARPVQNFPPLSSYLHGGSASGANLHFKPQQKLQTFDQEQSIHKSLPSMFSATSVSQYAETPQQSQYLTRPGQKWHQLSSEAITGQFVKSDQSQQTLRPAQGNYQVSQSRFPESSVGQHADSWKPVDAAKQVHGLQQQPSFPTIPPSSMHQRSLLAPISSQTRDSLTSSNYQTSQGSFNDQFLTQLSGILTPAGHVNYYDNEFKLSQSSRPSTYSAAHSMQNMYKPHPPRFQPVQSMSRDMSSHQQGQLSFAYPYSDLYAHSYPSTYGAPVQSSGPVGMASGRPSSGLGQTKG